jgi:Holliday junction resolvase RusA-like endonuclease
MWFRVPCKPPTRTSQGKGVQMVPNPRKPGKLMPKFFRKKTRQADHDEWGWRLQPFRPAQPLEGPLRLWFTLVYPHLAETAKRDRGRTWPKLSKPDCTNVMKAFEDEMVRQGFMVDDQRVVDFRVQKYHGPDADVGIYVLLETVEGDDGGLEAVCQPGAARQVEAARAGGQGQPGAV